jgi:hypothetical protein
MFAKIEKNKVVEWPIESIRSRFPNTSFGPVIKDSELPDGYVNVGVIPTPSHSDTETVVSGEPILLNDKWIQSWVIVPISPEELQQREDNKKMVRAERYRQESDPLFFKYQRGEATKEEWLAKVAEIKDIY